MSNLRQQLWTKWGENLDPAHVLEEYPREMLKREQWQNLNGYWEYAFTPDEHPEADFTEDFPKKWEGQILVPFSPESALSGVERQLRPKELLWYRRELPRMEVPETGGRVLLHFGAVDQSCAVYLNRRKITEHTGGYLPFDVDLTDFLADENELIVAVRDQSDTSYHAKGKQRLRAGGMYYTAVSGIWQTVWMETIPSNYIQDLTVTPDVENGYVTLLVHAPEDEAVNIIVHTPEIAITGSASRMDENTLMQRVFFSGTSNHEIRMRIPHPHLWSCEEPWLYYFDVRMGRDMVSSYFAFREIRVGRDRKGVPRIWMNGKPIFLKGVLDQGYWPESLYTPPADEAMIFDISEMKACGFNVIRKHAKIEPDRWYYHCDRLGMLVWQDIVNGGEKYKDWYVTYAATLLSWCGAHIDDSNRRLLARKDEEGREEFRREIRETAEALNPHPSVVCWTLFNEAWGQFETKKCTKILRQVSPGRLIDSASGWFDQGCGDFRSVHWYYLTFRFRTERKRAFVLSEFGGIPFRIPEHAFSGKKYGYGAHCRDCRELTEAYRKLNEEVDAYIPSGLCATVYTQWTDIEEEVNGIYTWDRKVKKIEI